MGVDSRTVEAIWQLLKDPKRLEVLNNALEDPKRAVESLDLLIRSENTSEASRKRYQDLRNSLEDYMLDAGRK